MAEHYVDLQGRQPNSELLELDGSKDVINKLDVMTSKQFNRILVLNIIIATYAFIHVAVLASLCATTWHGERTVQKGLQGEKMTFAICNTPTVYFSILYGIDILGKVLVILFSIFFVIRVLRNKKTRRNEQQIWSIVMMITTAVSYNPLLSFVFLDIAINKTNVIFKRSRTKLNCHWIDSL